MLFILKQIIMTVINLLIQLRLTISLGIHKRACLINLFSRRSFCVETSHLICSAYRLTGFFALGMSTDSVFRAGYTILFYVSFGTFFISFFTSVIDNF